MGQPRQFSLVGWRLVLVDLGIDATRMLRRARLPEDLLARDAPRVDTAEYFRLWRAFEEEADDPRLPLRIADAISMEAFEPSIFAACCSPDLDTALDRISAYKRLCAPMRLVVEKAAHTTALTISWLDATVEPPVVLAASELLFFVQLARLATRTRIEPLKVVAKQPPEPVTAYREYLGVPIVAGDSFTLVFSATDAKRPFLSANESMWTFFEPELRRRLAELDAAATTSERVRAALLELLPSGLASVEAVASKLAMSKRTLQRRLAGENETFQGLLDGTREQLARHYLGHSSMSGVEIAFLLGFEDPNSFFRAFHAWTGDTPESVRAQRRP